MMSRNNPRTVMLAAGFMLVLASAVLLSWERGFANLMTGMVWGIGIAYLGFLLFYFLVPRPGEKNKAISFIRDYLPGALLRYVIIIGAFCAVVFWLKTHPIGVLLGAFIGMMAATLVSLAAIRQAPPKPPPED